MMLKIKYMEFLNRFVEYKINESNNDIKKFSSISNNMYKHHLQMPDYFSISIRFLSVLLNYSIFILFGKKFSTSNAEDAITIMNYLRSYKRFIFIKNLIKFHDSLFIMAETECGLIEEKKIIDNYQNKTLQKINTYYDYIVTGSGPGGAIPASLLKEKGFNVLILDKGQDYSNEEVHSFSYNEMRKMYNHGGLSLSVGNQIINYVEGSCVGGGSEINSGLYHQTPENILQQWAEKYSLIESDYPKLSKYYKDVEEMLCVSYYPDGELPGASLKLAQGAKRLGWQVNEVPRWYKYEKDGSTDGEKMTMSETYLRKYLLNGGELLAGSSVDRLKQTTNGWEVCIENNKRKHYIKSKNVILSAGAIGTPLILQRSGLSKLAGKKLQMHPTIKVVALFKEHINSEKMGVPVHQVKEFSPDFTFGCSISSPTYLRVAMLDHYKHIRLVDEQWHKMAVFYAMIIPQGTGKVRKMPIFKDPLISYNLTHEDRKTLAEALKKLCELLLAAGAQTIFPSIHNGPLIKNVSDLIELPDQINSSKTSIMSVHIFSSCPMGEDRDICVVDSYGKVHGQKNLWVSDASMIPSATGVNPQGTIMAFAKRNAEKIIAEA